jgi:hypothetical protein
MSDDGKDICSFPAQGDPLTSNINVINRTTTVVSVNMQCVNIQGLDSGSVLVNATQSNCPVWNTIVANPENIVLNGTNVNDSGTPGTSVAFNPAASILGVINDGQQAVIVGSGTGPNQAALTFTWSITAGMGGTLSSAAGTLDPNGTGQPNGQSATNQTIFSCPAAPAATQTFTIQLVMNDGADAGSCDPNFTTGTVQIECSNPAPCGGQPTAPSGTAVGTQACDTNGTMTAAPPFMGTYPYAATSTVDPTGLVCCAPICNGTGPVATPANSTGTCTGGLVNNGSGCCVALLPCTTAGQANCVKCAGNDGTHGGLTNGVCSQTEADFVAYDILTGKATAPGNDPAGSCYACLYANTCLDDTHFGDTGRECSDTVITGPSGAGGAGSADQTLCEAVISCVLGSSTSTTATCATSSISTCYCGTAPVLGTCGGSASAANGVCDTAIAAALGFPVADGTDNLAQFTTGTVAGGVANQIFNCAEGAGCSACTGKN